MSQEQLEQIELKLEECNEAIKVYDALQRLANNKDFKLLVHHNYFVTTASDCVLLKAQPGAQSEEVQTSLDKQIIGIGSFRQYLSKVSAQGRTAMKAIEDCNEAREEILAEEL